MSSVLDEIRKEERAEGRAEGSIKMGYKFGLNDNEILSNIVEETNCSYSEARQMLEQYSDL